MGPPARRSHGARRGGRLRRGPKETIMSTYGDKNRAIAVTGIGIITSLGQGKAENWAKLTAGRSGIHALTRFPTTGLKTTIGGSVDFMNLPEFNAPNLTHAMARACVVEALTESG